MPRLAILQDAEQVGVAAAVTAADEDGDGIDDETGEPVADGDDSPDETDEGTSGETAAPEWPVGGTIERTIAVEGVETGDRRLFEVGVFTWAAFPLPYMATDETTERHERARQVAQIVDIERRADGETADIVATLSRIDPMGDAEVERLQEMVRTGVLGASSIDADGAPVVRIVVDVAGEEEFVQQMIDPEVDENGQAELRPPTPPLEVFESGLRIIGATAVPFPAIQETREQIAASLVALVETGKTGAVFALPADYAVTAAGAPSIAAPVEPPAEWYADPEFDGPCRKTVTDEGRTFGHLALWGSCHIGIAGECIMAPHSATNYAAFASGEIRCADGSRVAVGQITADCGHPALNVGASLAKEHYDHTGWSAADVVMGEDDYGIWFAGSVCPEISAARLRRFMATDVSGDWRSIDGSLELVGIASVVVGGFQKPQVQALAAGGGITALTAPSSAFCQAHEATASVVQSDPIRRLIVESLPVPTAIRRQHERDEIAASIGMDYATVRRQCVAEMDVARRVQRARMLKGITSDV